MRPNTARAILCVPDLVRRGQRLWSTTGQVEAAWPSSPEVQGHQVGPRVTQLGSQCHFAKGQHSILSVVGRNSDMLCCCRADMQRDRE